MPMEATHRIFNQVPDLTGSSPFTSGTTLQGALEHLGGDWNAGVLQAFGDQLGTPKTLQWAAEANTYHPELRTRSRTGGRIDAIRFAPIWHALPGLMCNQGLQALPLTDPRAGAWATRTAGYFTQAQIESSTLYPATMTFANISVLQKETALSADLGPCLYAREHGARDLPQRQKTAILVGMGMTEKQGDSDMRNNTVVAASLRDGDRGATYAITDHKWFFSVPMYDAHLVVTRMGAEDGPLSRFFVPRFRNDSSKNPIQIRRLKDKFGNRSNTSSEVEFHGVEGILIDEGGRGIPTIIEMTTHTRLDCVIGSAAILRHALMQALHHARHRMTFGRLLAGQPLMRDILADLALESQAATLLIMELGNTFGRANVDPLAATRERIVTPAAKFWACKRTIEATDEAMEAWGGDGYVEEGPIARLYRETPVNSIWEGSGNVMCLDALHAITRTPDDALHLMHNIGERAQSHRAVHAKLAVLQAMLHQPGDIQETSACRITQGLALTTQTALMLAYAHPDDAERFIASHFHHQHGRVFSTLDGHAQELGAVLQHAWPVQRTLGIRSDMNARLRVMLETTSHPPAAYPRIEQVLGDILAFSAQCAPMAVRDIASRFGIPQGE